jgi:hypothetical protein
LAIAVYTAPEVIRLSLSEVTVVSTPYPFPIVFVPVNFAIFPFVPLPVILFAILGVTVTVYATPPLGVTVKPLVPFAKV